MSKINSIKETNTSSFYSSGKLLLTGEYVVLDGALSLAVPTQFGQSLQVEPIEDNLLIWKSLDQQGAVWFQCTFNLATNEILNQVENNHEVSQRLLQILQAVKRLNPEFLKNTQGYKVTTALEFPKNWGLGTSSTLINNIANWANVDAYQLLNLTFGGSGYDIACAKNASAITYQLKTPFDCDQNYKRLIHQVNFNPSFKKQLYFVHLNKKQNSREGISQYKKNTINKAEIISEINSITQQVIACKTLDEFSVLIEKHEQVISSIIKQEPIKNKLFSDFEGAIKSLGAWGGDFVLATSKSNPEAYFTQKGYTTILNYSEMVI
ncbi:GYDIA family GHMP kinase [Lacinutrix salivirga]